MNGHKSEKARAIIAAACILGAFALSITNLVQTGSADLPAWAVALTASVSTFFFASKGSEVATENHVNMTDRLFSAEQGILANRQETEQVKANITR